MTLENRDRLSAVTASDADYSFQDRKTSIDTIIERSAETMRKNKEYALACLQELTTSDTPNILQKVIDRLQGKRFETSEQKYQRFRNFFETYVFSSIVHYTRETIADGLLKSPAQLSKDQNISVVDAGRHSGGQDIEMGNTEYVFATSAILIPMGVTGSNAYKLNKDPTYVAAVDIHNVRHPDQVGMVDVEKRSAIELDIYSKNLFLFEDFKEYFARYMSLFFENPMDAITFCYAEKAWMSQAASWDEPRNAPVLAGKRKSAADLLEESHKVAKEKMRQLFLKTLLIPPIHPEYQEKDFVQATFVEETDLITSPYELSEFLASQDTKKSSRN